jgi:hypothetical protein
VCGFLSCEYCVYIHFVFVIIPMNLYKVAHGHLSQWIIQSFSKPSWTSWKVIHNSILKYSWENHHCEKHGNTQISPNLSHKLWKRLASGMPGRSCQTKPGLPSGCQVNIKCFYAKSTRLGSNYRNLSSLILVQKVIRGYLQRTVDNNSRAYLWLISHDLSHGVPLMLYDFP